MIKARLRMCVVLLLSVCLVAVFLLAPSIHAENNDSKHNNRSSAWYQSQYGTNPWGGTWMMGQFGSDIGYGEQGMTYQYSNPSTGSFVSYSSTGLDMGMGGVFAGYGGMFSPLATASYGPFAYGNDLQPTSTFGWSTQGSMSGSVFGPSTSYYMAQPSSFGLMGGLFGGFGGFGGLLPGISYGGFPISGYGLGGWAGGYGWW